VIALWGRLPVIARAVLTGGLVAVAGTTPWAVLVSLNIKHGSAVPWAVPPTALYLWLFWRWIRGAGWPRSTAEARRVLCRANPVSDDAWAMALVAGLLGLVAVLLFQGVMGRLVTLPQQQDIDPSQYPIMTVALWVLMSAAVAGVTEEAAFRGYLQGPIERRHGPVLAILITGLLFGLMHFTHPEVTLVLLPFYLAVAAVYGMLAYLTNSILPSVVLHGGGNVFAAFALFAGGRSEWQATAMPKPSIWETGADASFWILVALTLVVGAAAVWAYAALARVAKNTLPLDRRLIL
jgi:membrane protease YdiL (CAAX protease family)